MHTFQGITEEGAGAPRRRPQGSRGRELRWVSGPDAEWQRYLQTATCQGLEQEVPSSGDIRARNGGETIPLRHEASRNRRQSLRLTELITDLRN